MGSPAASLPAWRRLLQRAAGGYLLLLTLLLPLKFGVIAVMPEATGYFPDTFFEFLIVSWPSASLAIAGGIALLLALPAFPRGAVDFRSPAWRIMALWSFAVPLLALPGFFGATTLDFPLMELSHLAGVGAYAAAVYLYLADDPERKYRLLGVLAAGVLLLGYFGLEQHFFGFARSRQFLLDQEAAGATVSEALRARTFDTRVFATFTSCNSLAGYLLLLLPATLAVLWRWAGRIEPVRLSRGIFLALGGVAVFAVLLLTRSRAAYLALLLLPGLAALAWPMRRSCKMALLALALFGVLGGAFYIHHRGRGFESMAARADYLRSSAILLLHHPLAGAGWGEFFHEHMRIKTVESDEAAHDPHNIIMTAAQAGIGLTLAVLLALLYPIWLLWRRLWLAWKAGKRILPLELAGLIGLVGFLLHSQMDTNIQVPACMAAMTALTLALLIESPRADAAPAKFVYRAAFFALAAALGLYSLWSGVRILNGEIAYDRLNTLCSAGPAPAAGRNRAAPSPEMVRRALDEAVNARPFSPFPWTTAGGYMLGIGYHQEAERLTEEALKRAPKRSNLYFRLYLTRMLTNRPDEAEVALRRAQELFPNNPRYRADEAAAELRKLRGHLPRPSFRAPASSVGPLRRP